MRSIPLSIRACHMANLVSPITELLPSRPNWAQRLISNRSATIGLIIVLLYIVMALAGLASITPYPANEQHPKADQRLQPPSAHYLMGSDQFGRDIFSRVISGSTY